MFLLLGYFKRVFNWLKYNQIQKTFIIRPNKPLHKMQIKTNTKQTQASDLKKDKTEKASATTSKRANLIKKVLELVGQHDQDIYICLHDKKQNKVFQYSSNVPEFGLNKISKLLGSQKRKTDAIQSLGSFQ